jgi:predicted peroxiredoxin
VYLAITTPNERQILFSPSTSTAQIYAHFAASELHGATREAVKRLFFGKEGGGIMNKKAKRILALLNDPRQKNRLLNALNNDTMDAAAPVGKGDQEMKVLKEMNEPQEFEKMAIRRG